jgi:predicted nucleic acid-binding protein
MIYLDTHVIVRLYATAAKGLSDNIIQLIEKEQDIRISPMARLELEYLYENASW